MKQSLFEIRHPLYVRAWKWLLRSAFFQYNVYKWHDDLPSADKHNYYKKIDRGGTKTILHTIARLQEKDYAQLN